MNKKLSRRLPNISKRAKVQSDKPAYKEKKKTDKGYVWVYDEKHVEKRWKEKKEKMKNLEKNLKKVRDKYQKDLTSDNDKTRAIAAIVGIMDDTAMRIGNEESAKEGTFGATTLKVKHVKGGSGNITFDFPGKGAIEQNVVLKNNKVIKVVRDLMKGKKKEDFIFEIDGKKIWDRTVNRYLKEFNISAKDLRGFHANRLMKDMLKKKDFKEALKEVADIVGHEEATLKNQYLDPELVAKHEGKKKKANISSRAKKFEQITQEQLGSEELQSIPAEVFDYTDKPAPISSTPKEPPVDLNRNVSNIKSKVTPIGGEQVKITPQIALAWRIIAPFLPLGAELTSGFRSELDQANTIWGHWNRNWNGYFAKTFPEINNKKYRRFYNLIMAMYRVISAYNPKDFEKYPQGIGRPKTKKETLVALPGKSKHQTSNAIDIGLNKSITYSGVADAVDFINANLGKFINLSVLAEGNHAHIRVNNVIYPGTEMMEYVLRKQQYGNQSQKCISQRCKPSISKRALLNTEHSSWVNNVLKQKSISVLPTKARRDTKQSLRIKQNVRLNSLILDAWRTLSPFLPRGSMMTSGFRTEDDQKRILNNYWKKATGKYIPEHLKSDERVWKQVSVLLQKHHGYLVNPPTTKKEYGHLKGNAFDISGANLDEIASVVHRVSQDKRLPVKFRKPIIEDKNNAVHVGIESATYDPRIMGQIVNTAGNIDTFISKIAEDEYNRQEQIESLYNDLLESNSPEDVVKEFETIFNIASFDEGLADDENDFHYDMGFGLKDDIGDWFEKSPRFRWRDDIPEFEIHDINELEAKKIAEDDPEKFFYRGLHKNHPSLESIALKGMLRNNAKFFFIFLYHEREEDNFRDMMEEAAEALSLQDARAFFYYHMHHKFPELGRGAIVQLIDTNPDSFFDFGLQKDYPDLEESAGAARNIKDPNKVELEQPEWLKYDTEQPISLRDRNANNIFKKAENPKIDLTKEEQEIIDVFNNTVEQFKLGTTVRIAGGWVRDKVMGQESKDIDIAVDNMMGKEFAKYVEKYANSMGIKISIGLIPAKPDQGKNLETAVIHMFGKEIEVVNLRDEEYDEESRHPVTTITNSPIKDAFRRDLTINSLFYNTDTKKIEDFTGDGINDIRNGVIRTPTTSPENEEEVGREITPKSIFMDDPLRVLRAIRFANRYGFEIKDDLVEAAKDPEVQDAFRKKITWERRQDELRKIMSERRSPKYALELIKDWGYRAEILQLPDKYSDWELDQNNPHHELNVWNHLMEALDNIYTITKDMDINKADRYILNWATFLHDIGKLDPRVQGTKQFGDQLRSTFHGHEESSIRAAEHLLRQLKGTRNEEIKRIQMLIDAARRMNPQHIDPTEQAIMSRKSIGKILQITKDFENDWQRAMEIAIADSAAHKEGWMPEYPMAYWESLKQKITDMPKGTATMGPTLTGNELMELFGRKGGPWLGQINKAMIEWQMENPNVTREQAIEFAKHYYTSHGLDKSAYLSIRNKKANMLRLSGIPQEVADSLDKLPGAHPRVKEENTITGQIDIDPEVILMWNYFDRTSVYLSERGRGFAIQVTLGYFDKNSRGMPQYLTVLGFDSQDPYETLTKLQEFLLDPGLANKMLSIIEEREKEEEENLADIIPLFSDKKAQKLLSKRAKDKPKAGVFIKLPRELAKQFPSLGKHDDSIPHITTLFIGLVPKEHEILLEEIVKRVAMEHDPFEISLDEKVSYFPATDHSDGCKVAKINIISNDLKKLHRALKKAILNAEMSVDDHFPDYKPHTTLEYMEPPKEKYDSDIPSGSWIADKIEIWNGDKKISIPLGSKKKD